MKKLLPKQIRTNTFLILAVGAVIAFGGIALNENIVLILIGLLAMFSSIIHHVIFYRCPHCGKFLDRNTGEFCPNCGKEVNKCD